MKPKRRRKPETVMRELSMWIRNYLTCTCVVGHDEDCPGQECCPRVYALRILRELRASLKGRG